MAHTSPTHEKALARAGKPPSSGAGRNIGNNPNEVIKREYERRTGGGGGGGGAPGGDSGVKVPTVDEAVQEEKARLLVKYPGSEAAINEANIRAKVIDQRRQAVKPEDVYPGYHGPRPGPGDPLGLEAGMSAPDYAERNKAESVHYSAAFGGGEFQIKQQEALNAGYTGRNKVEWGGAMEGELKPDAAMRQGFARLFESHAAKEPGGTMRSHAFRVSGRVGAEDLGKIPEGLEVAIPEGHEMVPGSFKFNQETRSASWSYRPLAAAVVPSGISREDQAKGWREDGVYASQERVRAESMGPSVSSPETSIPSGEMLKEPMLVGGIKVLPAGMTLRVGFGGRVETEERYSPDMSDFDSGWREALKDVESKVPIWKDFKNPLFEGLYEAEREAKFKERIGLMEAKTPEDRAKVEAVYLEEREFIENPAGIRAVAETPGRGGVLNRIVNMDLISEGDIQVSPAANMALGMGQLAAGVALPLTGMLGAGATVTGAIGRSVLYGGAVVGSYAVMHKSAEYGAPPLASALLGVAVGVGVVAVGRGVSRALPSPQIRRVGVEGVSFEGGKTWTGLSLEKGAKGRPIVGVAGGRVVVGQPKVSLGEGFKESVPKSSVMPEVELTYMRTAREVMGETQRVGVPSSRLQALDFSDIQHIPKEYAGPISDWIKGQKEFLIYGSSAQKVQMGGAMTRTPHDIDLMVPNAAGAAKEITSILSKRGGGPRVRVSPESPGLVEVERGGKWSHMLDIHEKGSIDVDGSFSQGAQAWGFTESGKSVSIGGFKFRALSDEGLAKGKASTIPQNGVGQPINPTETSMIEGIWEDFTRRGGSFDVGKKGGARYRLKDVGDFSNIEGVLVDVGGKNKAVVPLERFRAAADLKFSGKTDKTGFKYSDLSGGGDGRFYVASKSMERELFRSPSSGGAASASASLGMSSAVSSRSADISGSASADYISSVSHYRGGSGRRASSSGSGLISGGSSRASASSSMSGGSGSISGASSSGGSSSRGGGSSGGGSSRGGGSSGSSILSGLSSMGGGSKSPSYGGGSSSGLLDGPAIDRGGRRFIGGGLWPGGSISGREKKKGSRYSEDVNPILSSSTALGRFIL